MADNITIREIDPSTEREAILAGLAEDLTADELDALLVQADVPDERSRFFAAFHDREVVGFMAFIIHRFGGVMREAVGFQAAGVVTSRRHRGKGIFPDIVRFAEPRLRSVGGDFVFGFPNANAYPIWLKKLGYAEVPMMRWRSPTMGGLVARMIRGGSLPDDVLWQADAGLIDQKRRIYHDDIVDVEVAGGRAWAVRRRKKTALGTFVVLEIGGLKAHSADDTRTLLRRLADAAGYSSFFIMSLVASNPDSRRFVGAARGKRTPDALVFKPLHDGSPSYLQLLIYGGVQDTF